MELRHLRYFVAVAEERHFGRAATRLHMAQPPLSQQIKALEVELGVPLLRRTTRRVELTDAGETYLERARVILDAVEEAGREAQSIAAGMTGRLVIGCVGSATYSLLPRLARGLAQELPGIDFSFEGEMLVPDQVRAVSEGRMDIALLRPPVHDPTLRVDILRHDRLVVALADDHPLAGRKRLHVGDLQDTDLVVHVGRRDSVMHNTVLDLCRRAGFEPRFRAEVSETSTLLTLVAGGLGAAIVPAPVTSLELAGVTYLPLTGAGTVPLAVAFRSGRRAAHLHRALEAVRRLVADD
ncbi:LysR family transcriptional regulator [Nocardioides sp.]|uniref:LysR family transcriptional regulator n=1 Tax=Nocardioides sp. TaxID=35761 RepID=UPI003D0E2592